MGYKIIYFAKIFIIIYNTKMQRARILLILGIWISILSYLGFPYLVKNILFTVTGFFIIYISLVLYKNHKKENTKKEIFDNFSENSSFEEIDIEIEKTEEKEINQESLE